jgi:hypothetical protein
LQQTEQAYLITSPLRAGKCPWCHRKRLFSPTLL